MKKKLFIFVLAGILVGCKTRIVYLPVENVKHEYHEKILRDSIHLHDSIIIKAKGDTMFIEKYKTMYRNRIKTDSIFKTDSVAVPYPVVEYREVNSLSSFQSFQLWCGRILLAIVVLVFGIKYMKKFF